MCHWVLGAGAQLEEGRAECGVNENKYYARSIEAILEVNAEGNRTELVEFTTP